jgi:RNA polymerase sigma-70 factor (ECF subfamily)
MSQAEVDFPELLARVRAGDESATRALVERYEPEVRMVARYLLGPAMRSALDSMDVVQSVHRSLILGLRADRFEVSSPDRLVALAVTLIRRKVARHWRRIKARGGPAWGLSSTGPAGPEGNADDPAATAEYNDQVARILDMLDPADRTLVELRLDGHTTAEAARKLGADPNVVRVRLSRLRRRLAERGLLAELL